MMIARFGHRILEESEYTCEYIRIHTCEHDTHRTMMVQRLTCCTHVDTQMSRTPSLLVLQVALTTNRVNRVEY